GAQALDDLAHDLDLTAAVHLLLARAAVGAGVPADAGQHLDAVSALGALSPRRTAQLRIVRAAAVIAGGSPERLALSARLAEQAVTAAEEAADPELSCEALELLAMALRPRDVTAAADVLRRGLRAVAHGLAGRRADMEQRLRRAVELAPGDADIAAYATGGARGVVALLFEERAEALAAFTRGRELGAPICAADPWHTALLVRAVQGDATVSEVEAELARATVGARFPATWPGY